MFEIQLRLKLVGYGDDLHVRSKRIKESELT